MMCCGIGSSFRTNGTIEHGTGIRAKKKLTTTNKYHMVYRMYSTLASMYYLFYGVEPFAEFALTVRAANH